jgi:16S rRNA (cytosine967-C5)-methyltransferase
MSARSRPDARDVARRVLTRAADGAYASLALSGELERAGLMPADRALATELAYGVLRLRRRLDRALVAGAPRGLGSLDERVLDALRVAAYQLLCLDRVPAHAAVNDAVGFVRRHRGERLAGFANAVLRRVAERGEPPPPADPRARLIDVESYPPWLADLYFGLFGDEALTLAAAQNRPPPVWLRANPVRGGREAALAAIRAERPAAALTPSERLPEALRLAGGASPADLGALQGGLVTVQDLGAQAVGRFVGAGPGERILDACAGVGGKSTHLAVLAGAGAVIHAADVSGRKLELCRELARRLGAPGIETIEVDLTAPGDRLAAAYDRVLLDAPCTGLGVIRRHPELKWRRQAEDVPRLAALQRQLLETVARRVRPGGLFVYSVCTLTAEEGADQVRAFLGRHPEFVLESSDDPTIAALTDHEGLLRTLPHRHDADAFVAARMRRRAGRCLPED